jgi:hypothetical protein
LILTPIKMQPFWHLGVFYYLIVDFIFTAGNIRTAIEVGVNKKEYRQVIQTAAKVKATYSLVISDQQNNLEFNSEQNAIRLPLQYFILI